MDSKLHVLFLYRGYVDNLYLFFYMNEWTNLNSGPRSWRMIFT